MLVICNPWMVVEGDFAIQDCSVSSKMSTLHSIIGASPWVCQVWMVGYRLLEGMPKGDEVSMCVTIG